MSWYLVTGGAGFIGSHLVEALLARGASVRVLDDFSSGRPENLPRPSTRLEVVEGDLLDPRALLAAMRGVGVVYHQAARTSVPESVEDPLETNRVNVEGTLRALEAARQAGVRRFVFASSSAVYGETGAAPNHEDERPFSESPYGVSKLAGEAYCLVFARVYGLETVSLRYFNVFGPRQDPTSAYAAVIPRFIALALDGYPLDIHGDGLQSRDFVYVADVVQGLLLAAEAPGISGEVLNLACGQAHSVLNVARAIGGILGRPLELVHTSPRPGDVRYSLAEIEKAKRLLGYEPAVTLAAGLRATIDWFRADRARPAEFPSSGLPPADPW